MEILENIINALDKGTSKEQELIKNGYEFKLKTIKELDTEYKNWVEGKEDWHDKVVNEYKEKIAKMMEEKISSCQYKEEEEESINLYNKYIKNKEDKISKENLLFLFDNK